MQSKQWLSLRQPLITRHKTNYAIIYTSSGNNHIAISCLHSREKFTRTLNIRHQDKDSSLFTDDVFLPTYM